MFAEKCLPNSKVSVLTGAGISAESGIKTFRESGGLWENYRIDQVATPGAFKDNPKLVWEFYKERYRNALEAEPNQGHFALVDLEENRKDKFWLITQNIDGLHRKAGSQNLLEMHGRLDMCFCISCKKHYQLDEIDLASDIPLCPKCGGMLRPDIVWFGEVPYFLEEIENSLRNCNFFIVVGTSGLVYPAAGFVLTAKYFGAQTIGVNLDAPANKEQFDYFFQGKAGDILPELVCNLIRT